jgi:hypothetical protein
VLNNPGSGWASNYVTIGSVTKDVNGFHYWFSGGISNDIEGIGYAYSGDGVSWTTYASNPLFQISGAPSYRNARTYTPSVVDDGNGTLWMYYSALSTAGGAKKQIGLAKLTY